MRSGAISLHLPAHARSLLVNASNFPTSQPLVELDSSDQFYRIQTLDRAIERVRAEYPQFFKKEQYHESQT